MIAKENLMKCKSTTLPPHLMLLDNINLYKVFEEVPVSRAWSDAGIAARVVFRVKVPAGSNPARGILSFFHEK